MKIDLSLTSKVKDFVNVSQSKTCEVVLRSGRWVVDGKSILGVNFVILQLVLRMFLLKNRWMLNDRTT